MFYIPINIGILIWYALYIIKAGRSGLTRPRTWESTLQEVLFPQPDISLTPLSCRSLTHCLYKDSDPFSYHQINDNLFSVISY